MRQTSASRRNSKPSATNAPPLTAQAYAGESCNCRKLAGIEQAEDDPLAAASNAVVELIHAGKLDEAEHGARDLLVRFPDVHDGYDRLGKPVRRNWGMAADRAFADGGLS
jgi:hypothetical protein